MEKRLIATLPVGDKVLHIFLSCFHLSTPLKNLFFILISYLKVSKVACGSRKAEAYQISSMIKYLHESGLAFKGIIPLVFLVVIFLSLLFFLLILLLISCIVDLFIRRCYSLSRRSQQDYLRSSRRVSRVTWNSLQNPLQCQTP